jgi:hypothetical protein
VISACFSCVGKSLRGNMIPKNLKKILRMPKIRSQSSTQGITSNAHEKRMLAASEKLRLNYLYTTWRNLRRLKLSQSPTCTEHMRHTSRTPRPKRSAIHMLYACEADIRARVLREDAEP